MQTFEKFLEEKHALTYTGTDDNMVDDFDRWVVGLDGQVIMDYAQEWGEGECEKAVKVVNDVYNPSNETR
jgi:hypothetical protein